ncbi:MAG: 30S ribosomal protein S18 [Armatimonadetes bacterium]|jgi:small subunit ribosomal protein S18|nr:30S ribosomal protein S18 [Armatimonadota bacterium]
MRPRPQRTGKPFKGPRHRKYCAFCVDKIDYLDYKNTGRLRRFVSDRAKILPRRMTGTCAKHQRMVAASVKRAREIALLPYVAE